jgi:hypothetical protein
MAEVTENKSEFASDLQEFETRDVEYEKRQRTARVVESVRFGMTLLALLAGLTILGTSADTLSVYNKTHLGAEFFISLWPAEFDIRPTTALIICSAIIFLASTISLVVMKVPAVRSPGFSLTPLSLILNCRSETTPLSTVMSPSPPPSSASSPR